MRPILFLIISMNVISGCNGQNQNSTKEKVGNKDCIILNNKGFEHSQKYFAENNPKQLDTALDYLNQAVKCNPGYFVAYKNMADVYGYMRNYNTEIVVYKKLISLSNNNPLWMLEEAELYKKLNMPDSAKQIYLIADSLYDVGIKKNPENIDLITNKIILKSYSEGKEEAIKERNKEIKKHPNDSTLIIRKTKFLDGLN